MTTTALESPTADLRAAFVRVIAPEAIVDAAPLRAALARREEVASWDPSDLHRDESFDALRARARDAGKRWRERARTLAAGLAPIDVDVLAPSAALACAPLFAVFGAWLHGTTSPGTADEPSSLMAMSVYADDVMVGHEGASRGHSFRGLLRRLGCAENINPVARLAMDRRVADRDFEVPTALLTLGQVPDALRLELLAADLCVRDIGTPPPLALLGVLRPDLAAGPDFDPRHARRSDTIGGPSDRIAEALESGVRASGEPDRVRHAYAWLLTLYTRWADESLDELARRRDPAQAMAMLLRDRAREAGVYHQRTAVEGCPLSEWFASARTEPESLVDALARSRLVRPGQPDRSPLVTTLVAPTGPMFRIFTAYDLVVMRRWIESLPNAPADRALPRVPTRDSDEDAQGMRAVAEASRSTSPAPPPTDLREAYHRLQVRDRHPRVEDWAADYVAGWLARSGVGLGTRAEELPTAWPLKGLRPWLLHQHDRHDEAFQQQSAPLPGREALVESTVQLAPLTLIDGAWLQGMTHHEQATGATGAFLVETYWDELGNGIPELNHPRIYRQVLREMGVDLPATGSRAFSADPRIDLESLELPVYWLCIGRFPRSFKPEILGLNLAMELSGVGGHYRRARLALKEHGFSTRFVDIHNTIDNVATGHAAWAADAIDSFMSATSPSSSDDTWNRVRIGFRSLAPDDSRRAIRAQARAQRRNHGKRNN